MELILYKTSIEIQYYYHVELGNKIELEYFFCATHVTMVGHYDVRKYFNKRLALSCSLIALSSFNYAFDNQGFAQTQAMDAFEKTFGVYDAKAKTWALDTQWKSYFNGIPYLTFACGTQ